MNNVLFCLMQEEDNMQPSTTHTSPTHSVMLITILSYHQTSYSTNTTINDHVCPHARAHARRERESVCTFTHVRGSNIK